MNQEPAGAWTLTIAEKKTQDMVEEFLDDVINIVGGQCANTRGGT